MDFYLGRATRQLTNLPSALPTLEAGSVLIVTATETDMPDLSGCRGEVRFDETRRHLRCVLITMPGAVSEARPR
ncbi:MAG: hypothetical protein V1873_09060 [Verrucomicrobiota bacterium]